MKRLLTWRGDTFKKRRGVPLRNRNIKRERRSRNRNWRRFASVKTEAELQKKRYVRKKNAGGAVREKRVRRERIPLAKETGAGLFSEKRGLSLRWMAESQPYQIKDGGKKGGKGQTRYIPTPKQKTPQPQQRKLRGEEKFALEG